MTFDLNTIIPGVATVLYMLLSVLVTVSKPQNSTKRRFRFYLLSMLVWSISAFMVMADFGNTTFWFRLMTAGGIAAMITLFYFTQGVVHNPIKTWSHLIYIYGFFAAAISLITDLIVPHASIINGELIYELSPLIAIVIGPGYLLIIFRLFQLYRNSRESRDEAYITRNLLLVLAIIVVLIGGASNFIGLGKYPVDIAANVVAALIITYSILRHQLLDIRVVIRKSILYTIPTVIIGAAYFLVLTLAFLIYDTDTQSELFTISLIVSIIAAIIIKPFRDMLQSRIDRFFFRERYSEVMMIQRISQAASSVIDINLLYSCAMKNKNTIF